MNTYTLSFYENTPRNVIALMSQHVPYKGIKRKVKITFDMNLMVLIKDVSGFYLLCVMIAIFEKEKESTKNG